MKDPDLVARCVGEMQAASPVEVTVKCRIGVDDQTPAEILPKFLRTISQAGVRRVTIHARKAWLSGLSPKENRDVPPLDYDLVHQMKAEFADLHVSINGGITDLDQVEAHLQDGMDGVMIGRAAYHDPAAVLLLADARIFGDTTQQRSAEEVALALLPYIEAHLVQGGRLNQITRHILGLFAGRPGARGWKRHLSQEAHREGAGPEVVEAALSHVIALAA
jgi:tRNA-dihydrouridine synthase A